MPLSVNERRQLEALERTVMELLPQIYQRSYDEVQPVSMGSAGLKFDTAGQVRWNEIWGSFCDLAMAGGPPHKGLLLEPASADAIGAQGERYDAVVAELCRGVTLVTGLPSQAAPDPGWIRVTCTSAGMAAWLLRAIIMENVSARAEESALDLPAGPAYRLEKEIKNVITVIAKTCHYWQGHIAKPQQYYISDLIEDLTEESPLIRPDATANPADEVWQGACAAIRDQTGLESRPGTAPGWLGVDCRRVRDAIWMMRMMMAANILARREETTLLVACNPHIDPGASRIVSTVCQMHRFAIARGYF